MLECWSCWPSAIEEVLKFRSFFGNKLKKINKKKIGGEEHRRPDKGAGRPEPARRRDPRPARRRDLSPAIGLSRAVGQAGSYREVLFIFCFLNFFKFFKFLSFLFYFFFCSVLLCFLFFLLKRKKKRKKKKKLLPFLLSISFR